MFEPLDRLRGSHLFIQWSTDSNKWAHPGSLNQIKHLPKAYNQITSVVWKQPDHSTILIISTCLTVLGSSQWGSQKESLRAQGLMSTPSAKNINIDYYLLMQINKSPFHISVQKNYPPQLISPFSGLQSRQGHVFLNSHFTVMQSSCVANFSSSCWPDVG